MADFTTVQVSELPPSPPTNESILAHQVGDILSRMTIAELKSFIGIQDGSKQYEVKFIEAPSSVYINDNFDMTIGTTQGIGKIGGLWEGWAICNGNNGTSNVDGRTMIGYGATHLTVGEFLGSATHTLTESQIPSHSHTAQLRDENGTGNAFAGGNPGGVVDGTGTTSSFGGGLPHNNMQPSMVILMIKKL